MAVTHIYNSVEQFYLAGSIHRHRTNRTSVSLLAFVTASVITLTHSSEVAPWLCPLFVVTSFVLKVEFTETGLP